MASDSDTKVDNRGLLWAVLGILVVVFVFCLIIEIQFLQKNTQIDKLKSTVNSTQALVDGAVNNPGNAAQAEATNHAIDNINRMAQAICGGECPPVTTTTTVPVVTIPSG